MKVTRENIETFDLDPGLKMSIYDEYIHSLRDRLIVLVVIQVVVFILTVSAAGAHKDINGYIQVVPSLRSPLRQVDIKFSYFVWSQVFFHILLFIGAFQALGRIKIGLLKDYKLGKGIKEVVMITEIIRTPATPVYVTSSLIVKTLTNERLLRIGDQLTIYYLKYSGRLLYIEPA